MRKLGVKLLRKDNLRKKIRINYLLEKERDNSYSTEVSQSIAGQQMKALLHLKTLQSILSGEFHGKLKSKQGSYTGILGLKAGHGKHWDVNLFFLFSNSLLIARLLAGRIPLAHQLLSIPNKRSSKCSVGNQKLALPHCLLICKRKEFMYEVSVLSLIKQATAEQLCCMKHLYSSSL